jgi:hypothetical protein
MFIYSSQRRENAFGAVAAGGRELSLLLKPGFWLFSQELLAYRFSRLIP